MFYKKALTLTSRRGRPTFYTNFVSTLDGKVAVYPERSRRVQAKGYWPIGSAKDREVLVELRAHADALIHGRTTASSFPTAWSLAKPSFAAFRRRLGKKKPLLYIVVSASPDTKLLKSLRNNKGIRPLLVTTLTSRLPRGAAAIVDVMRLGKKEVGLPALARFLRKQGVERALVEGGPTLMGSFFSASLIDEVFLTIAPKVFGNEPGRTRTMVEGALLPRERTGLFRLVSAKKAADEMFLRYRIRH